MPTLLKTPEACEAAGGRLVRWLSRGDFIGLVGDLGAGKTCFVRGLVKALVAGADAQVASPTFTLINRYEAPAPFDEIAHIDLYRLEDMDDLESTGYWDVLDEAGLVIVEWIDRLPDAAPEQRWHIELAHHEQGRTIALSFVGGERQEAIGAFEAELLDET